MLHAALHIAAGLEYAGHRVKKRLVIYVAAEGQSSFINRVLAARAALELPDDGVLFKLLPARPNLGWDDGDAAELIEDIQAQLDEDETVGVVIIDTVSRVMGGANENNEGMAAFVDNAGLIGDAFECLVSAIHHTGKDEARGKRGWSGLGGATDCEWEFAEGVIIVRKMRDGDDGWTWKFQLKQVQLTHEGESVTDEDGDPLTSCVVELLSKPAIDKGAGAAKVKETKRREPPRYAIICREAIDEALIRSGGENYRPGGDGPLTKAVRLPFVRDIFKSHWAVDEPDDPDLTEAEAAKQWRAREKAISKDFNKGLALLSAHYRYEKRGNKGDGWVWKVEKKEKAK